MKPERKTSLSHQRQSLVEMLQRINFGKLERIQFRNGQPELSDDSKIIREHKFLGENGPHRASKKDDFPIKRPLAELFHYFDQHLNGEIETLEIKHGLPFRMTVVESAT